MNLLAAGRAALDVLKIGRELRSAEKWKNAQAVTSLLFALLALAAAFGLEWHPSAATVDNLANAASALVSAGVFLLNAYATWATSKRVGVPGTDARRFDLGPPDGIERRKDPEAPDAPDPAPAASPEQAPAPQPRPGALPAPAPRARVAARPEPGAPRLGMADRLRRSVPPPSRPDPDPVTRPGSPADRVGFGDRD